MESQAKTKGYFKEEVIEKQWKVKKKKWMCPWIDFPRKYQLSYKSDIKQRWNFFIVFLAIYNVLRIPF